MDSQNVEARRTVDSQVLRAMAHPLRRRLLDVLAAHGPSSVSGLAEATSQRVGNISFHLKVLARAGLIAEAPELARDRRERWWRHAGPVRWSTEDFNDDPVDKSVVLPLQLMNLDRQTGMARDWFQANPQDRSAWKDGAFATERWMQLTPAELGQLHEELEGVLSRWAGRASAPRGTEAREPVLVFGYGLPAHP